MSKRMLLIVLSNFVLGLILDEQNQLKRGFYGDGENGAENINRVNRFGDVWCQHLPATSLHAHRVQYPERVEI